MTRILEWEHVWVRRARRWILQDICLSVPAGRCVCLVGPAGGGKTTLLHTACGIREPQHGRIWLNGRPMRGPASGIVRTELPLPGSSAVESILRRRLKRAGLSSKAADERVQLTANAWDLQDLLPSRFHTLSQCQQQRARLAIAWASPGTLMVCDNPTALLEPQWRDLWPHLLKQWRDREHGAALIAANDPEEAMTADVAVILHEGRVAAAGPPARLCRKAASEEIIVRTIDDSAAAGELSSHLRLEAERRHDGLHLRMRHADNVLPGVLHALGASVETVWVRKPTMHDAVAHFTSQPQPKVEPPRPGVGYQASGAGAEVRNDVHSPDKVPSKP